MIYSRRQYTTVIGRLFHAALHGVLVILGAALFASFCFLVLPLLQAIAKGSTCRYQKESRACC